MTYAAGSLIQASDYNNFLGGNTSNANTSVNSVWSTGYGNAGYGQTSNLANVAPGDLITAQQWNSLIYVVNQINNHQSNANSNISSKVVGNFIIAQNTIPNTLSYIYNNRLTAYDTGNVANYNQTVSLRANGNQQYTGNVSYSIRFESADKARYFFNAGGNIALQYFSFQDNFGNDRSQAIANLTGINFIGKTIKSNEFTPREGYGGTLITDVTTGAAGFYGINASPTTKFRVDNSGYLSGDYFLIDYWNTGSSGSNGGNGTNVEINATIFSSNIGSTNIGDILDCNVTFKLTVNEPEVEYLDNSWGNITVIASSSPVPSPVPPPPGTQVYATAGTYSFTVPALVTTINCSVIAGGGGASGANYYPHFNFWSGMPGGSGGYNNTNIAVTPGETLTVTVGAAGTPGDYFHIGYGTFICGSSSWSAGNGGNSSVSGGFGTLSATGGYGGNQYSVYVGYVAGTNPGPNGGLGGTPNGGNASVLGYNFIYNGEGVYPGGTNGSGYGAGGNYAGCPTAAQPGAVVLTW